MARRELQLLLAGPPARFHSAPGIRTEPDTHLPRGGLQRSRRLLIRPAPTLPGRDVLLANRGGSRTGQG